MSGKTSGCFRLKCADFHVVCLLALLLSAGTASAAGITVQKSVKELSLAVGSPATVRLTIINPFTTDLTVRVADKNVFGSNGIDIQCLEGRLPAGRTSVLDYQPIEPYSPGKFTLPPAAVNYTDPQTGKEVEVQSNALTVDVGGSRTGQAQGITMVYQCNGVNMQSTSFSSSGSQSGQQQNPDQSQQQQDQLQQKLSNNQMGQDMNALKRQQEEMQRQKDEMQKQFGQNLESNPGFRREQQRLQQQGYQQDSRNIEPSDNVTGSFKMGYKNSAGQTAVISGRMENNRTVEMRTENYAESMELIGLLLNDTRYKNYNMSLCLSGFNMSEPVVNNTENFTEIEIPYIDAEGREASITGFITNRTVKKVLLKTSGDNTLLLIIAAAACLIAGIIFVYRKGPVTAGTPAVPEKLFDYTTEAGRLLREAEALFAASRGRDAYGKAGEAVRFFCSHKYGDGKELTNTEAMKLLRSKETDWADIQECLNLCCLVEFAKYGPNSGDFSRIARLAWKFITG